MNIEQLAELQNRNSSLEGIKPFDIQFSDFTSDPTDRTLIYGYSPDHSHNGFYITHHVYLRDGRVHMVQYKYKEAPSVECSEFSNFEQLVPKKRAYPESCDYDFCKFLQGRGVDVMFTTYSSDRASKLQGAKFHGETF